MSSDRELQQQHLQQLKGSALSDDVIEARGYWTATRRTEVASLGFQDYQCRVPALVLPQWSLTGEQAGYLIRPDNPRVRDGKEIKYEAQAGVRSVLDVHPLALEWIKDPARPLIITEGIKKADAAVSQGLPAIGLLGVYGWLGKNGHGGTDPLPDWEYVPLKGREVLLVFDSDVRTNDNVAKALGRLAAFLRARGAA